MPTLKTLCIGFAIAGTLFTGVVFAEDPPDLKPSDDWATFEKFVKKKHIYCTTCHQLDKKLVGPSYQEVAAKHKEGAAKDKKSTVKMLAEKIINGNLHYSESSVHYGDARMPPNSDVNQAEAKKIAEWILSLGSKTEAEAAKSAEKNQ